MKQVRSSKFDFQSNSHYKVLIASLTSVPVSVAKTIVEGGE